MLCPGLLLPLPPSERRRRAVSAFPLGLRHRAARLQGGSVQFARCILCVKGGGPVATRGAWAGVRGELILAVLFGLGCRVRVWD